MMSQLINQLEQKQTINMFRDYFVHFGEFVSILYEFMAA